MTGIDKDVLGWGRGVFSLFSIYFSACFWAHTSRANPHCTDVCPVQSEESGILSMEFTHGNVVICIGIDEVSGKTDLSNHVKMDLNKKSVSGKKLSKPHSTLWEL